MSEASGLPFLVPAGWVHADVIDSLHQDYRLLWYADDSVRFEHKCKAGDGTRVINAPLLSDGHQISSDNKGITIHPSILCRGCGLHGFIRNGRWKSTAKR